MSGAEQAERQVFPRVLWLTPSEQRQAALVDSLARQPAESWRLFRVARFSEALTVMLGTNNDK